jgi:hypothetical protein
MKIAVHRKFPSICTKLAEILISNLEILQPILKVIQNYENCV